MKTVLLGPNGQLGSDIVAANLRRSEPLALLPISRREVDLSDIEATIRRLRDIDFRCLINCSGYHKTDEAEGNPQLAFTINAHLVGRLAELCAEKTARLVHISTDYVFGGDGRRTPLTETDPKSPINVYGSSKAMGEDLALATSADVLIVRVASLFGIAGASGKGGNFVETMLRLAKANGAVRVIADQTMSPTATADAADAILDLLQAAAPRGIWHVVNSGQATWHAFAACIVKRAGIRAEVTPIATSEYPTSAQRPAYSVLDIAKLQSAIRPMRPWEDALDGYLAARGHIGG